MANSFSPSGSWERSLSVKRPDLLRFVSRRWRQRVGPWGAQDVCQVWQSLWADEWKGGLGWRAASVGVGSGDEPSINQLLSARLVRLFLHCCSFYSHSDVFAKGDRTCSPWTQAHCLSKVVRWKNFGGKKKLIAVFCSMNLLRCYGDMVLWCYGDMTLRQKKGIRSEKTPLHSALVDLVILPVSVVSLDLTKYYIDSM